MQALEQALSTITGMTPDQRGFKVRAAEKIGVTKAAVNNWFHRGFNPKCAVRVWEASGRKADLIALIDAGKGGVK